MATIAEEIIDYGATLDFQLRSRYETELDATEDELDLAFGKYTRPAPRSEWISCGLNGCDQPHRYGFVIRLHDGRETQCGPDCGERHFGAKWAEVVATVKAAEEAAATKNSVAKLLVERDAMVARGVELAERSRLLEGRVSAANLHLSSISALRKAIENCAKNGGSIRAEVEGGATGIAATSRAKVAQLRTIAIIEGVDLFTTAFMRYSAVIDSSLPGLRNLNAEMLSGGTQRELARRSKEGQQFASTLDRAERQLRSGTRLFEPANLHKLELLVEHQLRSADVTPRLRKALSGIYAIAPTG